MEESQTLKKQPINHTIDLSYVTIIPKGFILSIEFIRNLNIDGADEKYLKAHESVLGHHLFIFTVKYHEPNRLARSADGGVYNGEWEIRKRVEDVRQLEKDLRHDILYRFKQKEVQKESQEITPQQQMENMNHYIQHVLSNDEYKLNPPPELLRFLEISYVSYGTSQKYKECYLRKKAGGRFSESKCARCGTLWGKWDKRYFIITSESVMYSKGPDRENNEIREVLSFDYNFTLKYGKLQTGHERGIQLRSTTRKLELIAPDLFIYFDFLATLKISMEQSPYLQLHRFDSFAPIRKGFAKWYNSGQDYFSDMFKALKKATQSVYITDWWLSPEFYLQRPVGQEDSNSNLNRESRLDLVLKSIADRGVQVKIIVYNEPTLALSNDSEHTKTHLERLSPNIKVHRHPNQPFFWSHHEKMVVIDQTTGFMGGLDLCFGRMDNPQHLLFDQDYEQTREGTDIVEFWPGIDFSNSRVKDFVNVKQHQFCLLPDKRGCKKMPWQDIALQVIGQPVEDMVRHFIQYWNFVTIDKNFKNRTNGQLLQKNRNSKHDDLVQNFQSTIGKLRGTQPQEIKNDYVKMSPPTTHHDKVKPSEINLDQKSKSHFDTFLQKLEEELHEPLMKGESYKIDIRPFQNQGEESKEIDLRSKQNEQLSINSQAKSQGRRMSQLGLETMPNDLKRSYLSMMKNLKQSAVDDQSYERLPKIKHKDQGRYIEQESDDYGQWNDGSIIREIKTTFLKEGSSECQMLRSATNWSIGCDSENTERSIYVAYIQLITTAKNFIYIENQFFISITAGNKVKNEIGQALVNRIKYAAAHDENFKVIVFVPLLPGFEGEIDQGAAVMKVQLHWEYFTISRGGSSIYEQLAADPNIQDPSKYIQFLSLRQHAKAPLTGEPQTEIIYIHSKLIIIDDDIVLIGSANINDRSMLGLRDSEIAMVIQDTQKVNSVMGGKQVQVGKFAQTLRTSLYQSHMGFSYEEVIDPLSKDLAEKINRRARKNTIFYRDVFGCYPDDLIATVADYAQFKKRADITLYDERVQEVQGQVVEFPTKFLEKEDLRVGMLSKEYLLPDYNFT